MRILLIEDDQRVASFIRRGLAAEKFLVDATQDGQTGLHWAQSREYDLVILDLMLPSLSGQEVLQAIRKKDRTIPVLILTARGAVRDKVELFEGGCDDYLTKPFAFAELLARVKALLRRGSAEVRERLQVADLCVDVKKRVVTRGAKRIDLTLKEYALLEYLVRNARQVLSRSMIIEQVWDQSFDSFTNVVDVYIRYLRNKIDQGFEPKLIHTVRGVGYVLSEEGAP
ncbi:MAG: response regulator transcription factor [Acidobacteria bacterium]|nr:response regulator transcription factor [Acidobacteriota bacterium]